MFHGSEHLWEFSFWKINLTLFQRGERYGDQSWGCCSSWYRSEIYRTRLSGQWKGRNQRCLKVLIQWACILQSTCGTHPKISSLVSFRTHILPWCLYRGVVLALYKQSWAPQSTHCWFNLGRFIHSTVLAVEQNVNCSWEQNRKP